MEKKILFNSYGCWQSFVLKIAFLIVLLFNTAGAVYGQVDDYPEMIFKDLFGDERLTCGKIMPVKANIYGTSLYLVIGVNSWTNGPENTDIGGAWLNNLDIKINGNLIGKISRHDYDQHSFVSEGDVAGNWGDSKVYDDPDNTFRHLRAWRIKISGIPASYIKIDNLISIQNIGMNVGYIDEQEDDCSALNSYTTATLNPPSFALNGVIATPGCNISTVKWNTVAVTGKYEGLIYARTNGKDIPYDTTVKEITEKFSISGFADRKIELYLGDESSPFTSTTVSISSIDPLPIPADFQASTNKCDGSIDFKWQWTLTSPTNFGIYKSDTKNGSYTPVSETIGGSKRSINLSGFVRGKRYYFKIAAIGGKCPGLGPLSDDEVWGISPADPIRPTFPTIQLLTGQESGVKLTWNEKLWVASDFENPTTQKYVITRRDIEKGTETKIEIPIADLYIEFVKGKVKGPDGYILSYTDKEVSICSSYSYKISAVNQCSVSTALSFYEGNNLANTYISIANIDLSKVFKVNNLETSKGYYGNLVQLDWSTNENADFVGVYKIYRRVLGSTLVPELVQTVGKNTRSWADGNSIANKLYEYYIIAEADCGLDKLKSYSIDATGGKEISELKGKEGLASGIGFRLPSARVLGKITYEGGIAVPNVKVVAERDGVITGRALEFNGSQYVKINTDAKSIQYSKEGLSISLWIKPYQLNGTKIIASLKDVFKLQLEGNKVKVIIGNNEIESVSDLVFGEYTHIFTTCSANTLTLYINGKKDNAIVRMNTADLLDSSSEPIYLGDSNNIENYNGLIDEFRIYKEAVTAENVQHDYSRLIAPETANLVGYWRFDEGVGPFVFDVSKEEEVYHKNDGDIVGATWSTQVPSKEQLGFGGYTDTNGNYGIEGILYNGTGENFSITPTITLSGSVHAFTPTNRILFLGEGRTIENNIDFTDRSSFEVTGNVRFNFDDKENDNTHFQSSGSEGVSIWIDGLQQAMKDGKPILTDNFGQFKVAVPIGKHFLEFRKDGHVFVENRFPSQGTYDFQDRLSGIEVLDNTKHTLVGCVVGGLVQGNKKLGFLKYKGKLHTGIQRVNNIGTTYFTLTSVDTKIKRTVTTDPETGEFEIDLPPNEYEFSDVHYLGNTTDTNDDKVLFFKKDISSIKLANEAAYKGIKEELDVKDALGNYVLKTVYYNAEKRLICRSTPNLLVETLNGDDYLSKMDTNGNTVKTLAGEQKIKNYDALTAKYINIPTKDLLYPVFLQGINYQTNIKAVEKYDYYGEKPANNPIEDEVPVLDGQITVSNNISANEKNNPTAAYLKIGTTTDTTDTGDTWEILPGNTHQFALQATTGSVFYTFMGGDPNFLVPKNNEIDSFTKSMSITLKTGAYTIYWPIASDPSSVYKAYVMGGQKMPGTNFITKAPVEIETTLRMVPGTNSSITIEKGSSFTNETTTSTKGGGEWSFGIGPVLKQSQRMPLTGTILSSVDNTMMASTYGSKYVGDVHTTTITSSLTENLTISNSQGLEYNFNKGDFFISESKNKEIGLAKTIKFIPADNCVGCAGPTVTVNKIDYVLGTGEAYYQEDMGATKFLYSEYHIKTDIIPGLENMRNTLFINEPNLYVSKIPATYINMDGISQNIPLYGSNNDDPRWDDDERWDKDKRGKSNGTDYTTSDKQDDDGDSYTFDRAKAPVIKGIKEDKVRWYNDQIRAWREILMSNEIDKWAAIHENKPEKNISVSSGIGYTSTSTTNEADIHIQTNDIMAGASLAVGTSFTAFGVGFNVKISGGGSMTFGDQTSDTKNLSVKTSYTIQDNDPNNTLSVNVYKGKGNDSPIFQIVAGQTSCPFEKEKELEVTKKHLYYLEYWIKKIPDIISDKQHDLCEEYRKEHLLNEDYFTDHVLYTSVVDLRNEVDEMKSPLEQKKENYEALLEEFKGGGKPLLSNRTVQVQKPGLLVVGGGSRGTLHNVPSNKDASFQLELRNETELKKTTNYDATDYKLLMGKTSNPDGLQVMVDGVGIDRTSSYMIPFGNSIYKTVTIKRGPKKYNYKDLTIFLVPLCDTSAIASVKLDIDFIEDCSKAVIASPGNKWTVNYDSKNKLALKINDYDVNYQGFRGIKIQYKKASESDSDWRLLETYYRDDASRQQAIDDLKEDDKNSPLLTANDFVYNWDVSKLPDDLYDLRIQSICDGGDGGDVIFTSPTISGIIDRVNPSSFGAPQPSDGVLSAGDEIMLQFNEPINPGLLSPYNFDVRGVVQGGELRHPASVYFNGVTDYMEIPAGIQLNRRSFSVDFYAKRKRTGAGTLLSQGNTAEQSFNVGFNAADQFEVSLANFKVNSQKTIPADDSWVHYAYVYDASNYQAKLYINGVLDVIKQNYTPDYQAIGKILVGKDILGQKPSFQGNIHELRFWGKALSEAQVNVAATKRMKSNEPGLLGNWRMEETAGKLAEDLVRERHAEIVSGTWEVALKGNAISTGSSNAPTISSPAYLDVSNFSIEFWFKGDNTTNATLLSNGTGDMQDKNSNGWSVRASSTGLLEIWNNNQLFNATDNNYFDNQWHHFALVVNRLTNIVCFVDGNQQNTVESSTSGFSGFGGAALHLGAMGWIAEDGTTKQEQYFTGALDEVRIWQGARNSLQIKRDMRYMLSGDEAGLDLYLPFDEYKTTMGIELLVASSTSAANGITAVKDNGLPATTKGKVSYMQETPLVKLPRPVRKINFSYSANQDKIIMTTEDPESILENVILDVSVLGVQDMNGNSMRAPVTWTAYVDKNQVLWTESDKHFEIETGKGFTFETRIKNIGGKVFNFDIKNLPVWLTASPSSGVLAPVSSMPIVFTIDKEVNIGSYVDDIQLVTEFDFAETMNLNLDVFKTLPADWKVTPSNYQYSMNFITQLSINGDVSRDPNDQVAAFVGDECRGIAKLRYVPALDNYQAYINVYSNTTAGEKIEFRIWNASDGQVHSDVTPNYDFESNGVKGTATKPEILKAVDVLEYTYNLSKGWTWISPHLNYNYDASYVLNVNGLLKSLHAVNGDAIRDNNYVDGYSESNSAWSGTVTENGGIKNGHGYKILLNTANQLKYKGLLLKGDQVKIDLVNGWNWIGYIGFKKMSVNQALAGFSQVKEGDVIKSQFALAVYSDKIGWIGDLTHLSPGEGYMMRTAQAGSFYYPNLNFAISGKKITLADDNNSVSKIMASYKYPNSMNAIVEVVGDDQSVDNRLKAYVGKELRAEGIPVYNSITKKQTYFLTIYGLKSEEDVRFEFLDSKKNEIFAVNETLAFKTDALLGNAKKPEFFTLVSTEQLDKEVIVYPNPFTNEINIKLYKDHTFREISLFDLQGRLLKKADVDSEDVELDVQFLPSGVYLLNMYDAKGNILITKRVVK